MAKKNRKKRKAQNKTTIKTQNARVVGASGIGQRQDQGRNQRVSFDASHPYSQGRFGATRIYSQLYHTEWTAKKIVNIPVDDMLRGGWGYRGLEDDKTIIIQKQLRKIGFNKALRQALLLERLIGGSVIIMGIKDESDNTAEKLNLDTVTTGDLIFTNVVPKNRISIQSYDNNIFSENFGMPDTYSVHGHAVHRSRLIIFDGDPILSTQDNELMQRGHEGFGVSVLSALYDDINRSIGSRQSANHLINRASVLLLKNGAMQYQQESDAGKQAMQKLENIADQLSMFNSAMIDGKNVDIEQFSASFGSVPELLMSFLQIISAGSDIPASRFLGQAPGGLNATGTADLENYYNMIDAKREDRLKPQLEKFLAVQLRSLFGSDFEAEMVDIEFKPLWNMTEKELSEIRVNDTNNSVALVGSGIIDSMTAQDELKLRGALQVDPIVEPDLELGLTEDDIDVDGLVDKLGA